MSDQYSGQEALVLDVLESVDLLTLEQVIEHLPQLSWSQLFHTVDTLSRRGAVILRRRGFQYELALARRSCGAGV
ncbi:MAG TPA: hypothetical protein VJ692_15235 [Nitrospiraceae bacterium]|nr:hypothetical protein [Nitrospiraceae bacterium]